MDIARIETAEISDAELDNVAGGVGVDAEVGTDGVDVEVDTSTEADFIQGMGFVRGPQ